MLSSIEILILSAIQGIFEFLPVSSVAHLDLIAKYYSFNNQNYLIYIDMIKNVSIDEKSDEYEKYLNISKIKITNGLFNTYDNFVKEKYKIDINYKALNIVKNHFNQ